MRDKRSWLVVFITVLAFPCLSAYASTLSLRYSFDGAPYITISDTTPDYLISVTDNTNIWTVSFQLGQGTPPLPPPATIDLMSGVTLANGGTGTLVVELSQDDLLVPQLPAFTMQIGGTFTGSGLSVLYEAFADDENALFASTILLGSLGPFTKDDSPIAAQATSGIISLESPYSLTQRLTFTAENSTQGSGFTGNALLFPEPSTLFLLGVGFLSLAYCAGRRK